MALRPAVDAQSAAPQQAAPTEQEEPLGNWSADRDATPVLVHVAPDHRSVVWFERRGNSFVARLNGRPIGAEFDAKARVLPATRFSADGRHLAVQGIRAKKGAIIFDGKDMSAGFDEVSGMALSGDGQKLVYGAKTGKTWALMVNAERRAGPFDTCPESTFSADGTHMAYRAKRGNAWVVGLDGQEHVAAADEVLNVWVTDSGRLAYAARKKLDYFYVIDGKAEEHFNILGPLVFSADGRRRGYGGAQHKIRIAYERAVGHLVIDGQAGPTHDGLPLSGHWQGLRPLLYSLGHGVSDPVFSPDGRHVAHAARVDRGEDTVMLDDRPVATFDAGPYVPPPQLAFSPDSAHLAALGLREEALVELRDGEVVSTLTSEDDINIAEHFTWSPDSRRTAFVMGTGGSGPYSGDATTMARRRVVVEAKAGPEYTCDHIVGPVFSADSRHWGYAIVGEEDKESGSVAIVDGVGGKAYAYVYSLRFEGDTAVYVARDKEKFVRVTRPLAPAKQGN
jgi:hypothetical protein